MKYLFLLFLLLPAQAQWAPIFETEAADAVAIADDLLAMADGNSVMVIDTFLFEEVASFAFEGEVRAIELDDPWMVVEHVTSTPTLSAVHVRNGDQVHWPTGFHHSPALLGNQVTWVQKTEQQLDPYFATLPEMEPVQLDNHAKDVGLPTLNGRFVAWEDFRSTTPLALLVHPANTDLYMYDTKTDSLLPISQEGIRETDPEFNGNLLAYVRDDFSTIEVRLMDISKSIGTSTLVAGSSNVQFMEWDGDALLWIDRGTLVRAEDEVNRTSIPYGVLGASFDGAMAALRGIDGSGQFLQLMAWSGGHMVQPGCSSPEGDWFLVDEGLVPVTEICAGDVVIGKGGGWRVGPVEVPVLEEKSTPFAPFLALILIILAIGKKKGL